MIQIDRITWGENCTVWILEWLKVIKGERETEVNWRINCSWLRWWWCRVYCITWCYTEANKDSTWGRRRWYTNPHQHDDHAFPFLHFSSSNQDDDEEHEAGKYMSQVRVMWNEGWGDYKNWKKQQERRMRERVRRESRDETDASRKTLSKSKLKVWGTW